MILTMATLTDIVGNATAVGADGPLATVDVILYTNNVVPTVNTVLGDLIEADFDGYTMSDTVVWASPIISSVTGVPVSSGDVKTFASTDPDDQTIYGYALVDETGPPGVLRAVQPFDEPIIIANGGGLEIVPRFGVDQTAKIPPGDVTVL